MEALPVASRAAAGSSAGSARAAEQSTFECDGDEFHGPDRWLHDMNRQRILERAGWTFWRCFASTWKLRKEEVFQELLKRLTVMGIEPIGSLEQSSKLVERRTVTVGSPLTTE